MAEAYPAGRRILREPVVLDRTGLSRTQRWRDIRRGKFPAPVELGLNAIGWYEDEIEAWLAKRPRVAYAGVAASAETDAPERSAPGSTSSTESQTSHLEPAGAARSTPRRRKKSSAGGVEAQGGG